MKLRDTKQTVYEWYLTWRTGKGRVEREWEAWYDINVNWRARDITDMFKNFRHVVQVDPDRFFDHGDPFAWVPNAEAAGYFWPQRPLGQNAVWRFERVLWNPWSQRWELNEIGGLDRVFVATNSDEDAVMISLRFT